MRGLVRIVRFRTLTVVSALIYGSHAVHDDVVIRWSAAGIDLSALSLLCSEAVAAKVVV